MPGINDPQKILKKQERVNIGRGVVVHNGCIIEEVKEAVHNAYRVIELLGRFIETKDPQVLVGAGILDQFPLESQNDCNFA